MAEPNDAGGPEDLLKYLQHSRDAVVRAVEGLSEFDLRRPMTPTGTNLIGVLKHLTGVELGYLVEAVGGTVDPRPAWMADEVAYANGDLYATPEESAADIVEAYRRGWALSDASVRERGLDHPAHVPWWGEDMRDTTLGSLLVRMVDETGRHAGHCDILRELIDDQAGRPHASMDDTAWWDDYLGRVNASAEAHRD